MKRYKGIVGKLVCGKVYVHVEYAYLVIPAFYSAREVVRKRHPDINFNVCVWDKKRDTIRFCYSRDFDTASEPEVGLTVTVDLESGRIREIKTYPQVWHRKELWVQDDYTGFDVAAAIKWSEKWTSLLTQPADGSSRANWFNQLTRHGIAIPLS